MNLTQERRGGRRLEDASRGGSDLLIFYLDLWVTPSDPGTYGQDFTSPLWALSLWACWETQLHFHFCKNAACGRSRPGPRLPVICTGRDLCRESILATKIPGCMLLHSEAGSCLEPLASLWWEEASLSGLSLEWRPGCLGLAGTAGSWTTAIRVSSLVPFSHPLRRTGGPASSPHATDQLPDFASFWIAGRPCVSAGLSPLLLPQWALGGSR